MVTCSEVFMLLFWPWYDWMDRLGFPLCREIWCLCCPLPPIGQAGRMPTGRNAFSQFRPPPRPPPPAATQGSPQPTCPLVAPLEFSVLSFLLWTETTQEKLCSRQSYLPGAQGSLKRQTGVAEGVLVLMQ